MGLGSTESRFGPDKDCEASCRAKCAPVSTESHFGPDHECETSCQVQCDPVEESLCVCVCTKQEVGKLNDRMNERECALEAYFLVR